VISASFQDHLIGSRVGYTWSLQSDERNPRDKKEKEIPSVDRIYLALSSNGIIYDDLSARKRGNAPCDCTVDTSLF